MLEIMSYRRWIIVVGCLCLIGVAIGTWAWAHQAPKGREVSTLGLYLEGGKTLTDSYCNTGCVARTNMSPEDAAEKLGGVFTSVGNGSLQREDANNIIFLLPFDGGEHTQVTITRKH